MATEWPGFYGTLGDLLGDNARRASDAAEEAENSALGILEGERYAEEEVPLGVSEGGQVYADPEDAYAQQQALATLAQQASGWDPTGDERRRAFENQALMTEAGARGAAVNRAQERGGGAQAAEIAALQGADNQAWIRSDIGQGFAASNDAARLAALDELGQATGTMNRQQFGEGMYRASAIDRFNEANTQSRQDVASRNADAFNQRQRDIADARLGRAQRAENAATAAGERGANAASAVGTALARASDESGRSDRDSSYGDRYY